MKKQLYNGRGKVNKSIWYQDLSKIKSIRLEHISLLALPSKRRRPTRRKKIRAVSKAALHTRASQRTIALSQSKSNLYERLAKEQVELEKFSRFRVSPGARSAKPSERVKILAFPKIRHMLESRFYFTSSSKRRKRIDKRIKKAEQLWDTWFPRHIHSGISVVASVPEKKKKGFLDVKSEKKKRETECKQMEEHFARIVALSVPKKVFPPRRGRKRKWKPLAELLPRILKIIKIPPSKKRSAHKQKDPCQVSPAALKYKLSERIKIISKPKVYEEPKLFETPYDYMTHQATPCQNCIKLATPKVHLKRDDDTVNEFAFKVRPQALVAWCSPRTKKLAKPRRKFT